MRSQMKVRTDFYYDHMSLITLKWFRWGQTIHKWRHVDIRPLICIAYSHVIHGRRQGKQDAPIKTTKTRAGILWNTKSKAKYWKDKNSKPQQSTSKQNTPLRTKTWQQHQCHKNYNTKYKTIDEITRDTWTRHKRSGKQNKTQEIKLNKN